MSSAGLFEAAGNYVPTEVERNTISYMYTLGYVCLPEPRVRILKLHNVRLLLPFWLIALQFRQSEHCSSDLFLFCPLSVDYRSSVWHWGTTMSWRVIR